MATRGGKSPVIPRWSFGDRLRKARMHADLQQEHIAVEFGVSKVAVSNWELGKSQPRDVFETAERYENITGVSAAWLLTSDGSA